jgi:hypothetical protein
MAGLVSNEKKKYDKQVRHKKEKPWWDQIGEELIPVVFGFFHYSFF